MKFINFLAILPALVAAQPDMSVLGNNGLDVYNYEYKITVNENDEYTLTMTLFHDEEQPVGTADTCKPFEVASDGKEYFAPRWYYESFDEKTQKATGFNHISVDYNACGHPPGGFLQAHYDLHLYTISPEKRLSLTCDMLSSAPVCNPGNGTQTTENGAAFFEVSRAANGNIKNMPEGFAMDPEAAVPFMGTHVFHPDETPATQADWNEPVLVYCTHGPTIVAFESMFPFKYNHGDTDHFWERSIEMVNQDITTLPTYHSVAYEASTGVTTIVVKGKSATPSAEFNDNEEATPPSEESAASKTTQWLGVVASMLALSSTLA